MCGSAYSQNILIQFSLGVMFILKSRNLAKIKYTSKTDRLRSSSATAPQIFAKLLL